MLDSIELLTSELVTNVVLHARTGARLLVRMVEPIVRVEVVDEHPAEPVLRMASDSLSTSGRGMFLVEALADAWGVDGLPGDGKRVWFEVAA